MSALPPKADIVTQCRNVRFVPKADIRRLVCRESGLRPSALKRRCVPKGNPSFTLRGAGALCSGQALKTNRVPV